MTFHNHSLTKLLLLLGIILQHNIALAQECVLGSYETKFGISGENASRAVNLALAASKIDGAVLQLGEVISYNDLVGPRTTSAGFKKAHVISKGKLIDGIGGGACQVASTLHAAAIYSGFDIVESHAHSLASPYIQPSLDATVSYPDLDLKIQNPYNTAVKISVQILPSEEKGKKVIRAEFLAIDCSMKRIVTTSFSKKITKKRPVWIIRTSAVTKGSVIHQSGSDGKVVTRTISIFRPDGSLLSNVTRVFTFISLEKIVWKAKE
mgnify:FL=1